MKLIATQTVKVGGKYVAPGAEFEIDTEAGHNLVANGAAERKTRTVSDDEDSHSGDPATDPNLPASGATQAPDPNAVGQVAKTARRP